jgi:hypothetical protein
MPSKIATDQMNGMDLHQRARMKTNLDGHRAQQTKSRKGFAGVKAIVGKRLTQCASVVNVIQMIQKEKHDVPRISTLRGITID